MKTVITRNISIIAIIIHSLVGIQIKPDKYIHLNRDADWK